MQRMFITLRSNDFNGEIDLELPGDQPISTLMSDLLKVLNWPSTSNNRNLSYEFKVEDQVLNQDLSLNQNGIENFQTVWITPPATAVLPLIETGDPATGNSIDSPVQFWERLIIKEPCLVSPKGIIYVLGDPCTLIGRSDEGNRVDVDLTELEGDKFISSRKHAEILKTADGYALRPFQTTNGTLLNGNEITPEETYPLHKGDKIQFGFRGIQLVIKF